MNPGIELPLPGEWWRVPLDDLAAAEASVRDFVATRMARRDDLATTRRHVRRRLLAAAERAVHAGALDFRISERTESGAALAAFSARYRPQLPLGDVAEPAVVADRLVAELVRDDRDGVADHWTAFEDAGGAVFEKDGGLVVRRIRRIGAGSPRGAAAGGGSGDDAASLVAEYWLTEPGAAAVTLLTFTTALVDLDLLVVDLFDAVVAAAEWVDGPGDIGSGGDGPTLGAELRERG